MEILSDATFKGTTTFENNVNITSGNSLSIGGLTLSKKDVANGQALQVSNLFLPENSCLLVGGYNGPGLIGTCQLTTDELFLTGQNPTIRLMGSGNTVSFKSSSGTVALTSDIPSLSGYLTTSVASSTYQKKFTTFSSPSVPANCTAFEFTGTAISDSNKTHLIQVQNTSTGRSVIAETWMTANKKPAMAFAGCTSTVAAGTYTAIVL